MMDYLRLHRGKWQVRVAIPTQARAAFCGKTLLLQNLDAPDLRTANRLKGAIVAGLKGRIAEALNPGDPLLREARLIRHQLDGSLNDDAERHAVSRANELGDRIEALDGGNAARSLPYRIAVGFNTPLDHYFDQWCTAQAYTGKTVVQHRKAFAILAGWCKAQGLEVILESITRRVARDFLATGLRARMRSGATINRYLSTYRTYWAWLIKDERAQSNPWADTHIRNRTRTFAEDNAGKRPFEAYEVKALLTGAAPAPLPDLMMIAALTGARIDALCNLRVRDCRDGVFFFRRAKTERRGRTVPIHSALIEIVLSGPRAKALRSF
jgi:hypothetical protein